MDPLNTIDHFTDPKKNQWTGTWKSMNYKQCEPWV